MSNETAVYLLTGFLILLGIGIAGFICWLEG